MKIFLIGGKAGSGKGEVAKLIKEYYIYNLEESVITEYSKYLKLYTKELTDWDGNPVTKPRKYLQDMGDYIRNVDPKFFTKRMIEDINIYQNYVKNVIIADVRYPFEIEEILLNYDNVYSIYVDNQFEKSKLSLEEQAHSSETALETYGEFDITIVNDSDLESLKTKVFNFLKEIDNETV